MKRLSFWLEGIKHESSIGTGRFTYMECLGMIGCWYAAIQAAAPRPIPQQRFPHQVSAGTASCAVFEGHGSGNMYI